MRIAAACMLLAVVMAGIGLYASGQPAQRSEVVIRESVPPTGNALDDLVASSEAPVIGRVVNDAPLPILRAGSELWWWLAAWIAVVLAIAALLAARDSRSLEDTVAFSREEAEPEPPERDDEQGA
jgi:hypothetical protein